MLYYHTLEEKVIMVFLQEEVETGSQNHMQDFCKLEIFGCQGRSLLGCFSRSGQF